MSQLSRKWYLGTVFRHAGNPDDSQGPVEKLSLKSLNSGKFLLRLHYQLSDVSRNFLCKISFQSHLLL
jgi:hypothetical protein